MILSVRDKENNRRKRNAKKNKDRKEQWGDASYSESVRAKLLCFGFKLAFIQLMCKASSIFKSNLELALSIISKERELYKSKHTMMQCRCLKYEPCYPFDMFLNPSFKMVTSFVNLAKTAASTSKFIY